MPTGVFVSAGAVAGVPDVAGELVVGGVEEGVPLLLVLADKDHVRLDALGREVGVSPPRAQEGVVAEELLEVLVYAARPVVFDEERAAAVGRLALDVDDRVRTHEAT